MATLTLQDWTARAAAIAPEGQAFIAGDFAPAAEGKTYVNINPATGAVLNQVADCSSSDVDRAVSTARKAFDSGVWAHQSPSDRKRVLLRLADLMERDRETLALLESLDMGKPIAVSCDYEMPMLIDFVRWFAEATDKLYDEIAPTGAGTLALSYLFEAVEFANGAITNGTRTVSSYALNDFGCRAMCAPSSSP